MVARSRKEFLEFEARIEKVRMGREVEKLDSEEYNGVVTKCPIKLTSNQHR